MWTDFNFQLGVSIVRIVVRISTGILSRQLTTDGEVDSERGDPTDGPNAIWKFAKSFVAVVEVIKRLLLNRSGGIVESISCTKSLTE